MYNCQKISQQINTQFKIIYLEHVDSTNQYVKRISDKDEPLLVLTDYQTAGRGRGSKVFFSPRGGVYLTLFLPQTSFPIDLFTCAVAVAVCRSIVACTSSIPQVKWVNDIIVDNKKVCGILCENLIDGISVGLGVNLNNKAFPRELTGIAGAVQLLTSREDFVASIVNNIMDVIISPPSAVMEEYISLSMVIGREISFLRNGERIFAQVSNVLPDGKLELVSFGETFCISSGEIIVEGLYGKTAKEPNK